MDDMKRKESGVSEVIGAVLLVGLVVIGGVVVASFVFAQPTPKEIPHVSFGVSLNNSTLTLHHTGGDTLQWGEYNVYIYYANGTSSNATSDVADKMNPWSSNGDMEIEHVTSPVGNVVLAYKDGSGDESILRRVPFEDVVPVTSVTTPVPWTISGFKRNASGGEYTGPSVMITLYRKMPGHDSWEVYGTTTTGADDSYVFNVLQRTETYRIVETVPDGWQAVSPANRMIDDVKLNPGHIYAANQNFTNEKLPPTPTPSPTPTPTSTPTPPPTPTVTPTPSPTPPVISGHKYRVDENGNPMHNPIISGITIILERQDGKKWVEVARTTTDGNGYYEFTAPADGAVYRLREDLRDTLYQVYSPQGGIITGVPAGGALDQDFRNTPNFDSGTVMFLNKTVEDDGDGEDDDGGHLVDGTYLQGEAQGGDYVTLNGKTYVFSNNEQFRFTVVGNQYSGELKIEAHDLTKLTFNVLFQVKVGDTWVTPPTNGWVSHDPPASFIGKPSAISIRQINKNHINEGSTLAYRNDMLAMTDTLLRLNGEIRIDERDPPGNNEMLEFDALHIVHDNRYGEGRNTMWVYLEPGYDYILVQGNCLSP